MAMQLPTLVEGSHSVQINFSNEPPANLFCDEWFEIGVSLQVPNTLRETHHDQSSPLASSNHALHLTPVVHPKASSTHDEHNNVQVYMDPPTITFQIGSSSQGEKASARCRIHCPVDHLGPTEYYLSFVESWGTAQAMAPQPPITVKCSMSRPMQFVNAKLKLEPGEWEDVWYKDMGGRDKAMQAVVSMYGRDGLPIQKRKVPLFLTLLYDNEKKSPVMKQEILRMIGPTQNSCLEEDSGRATMQFRIEDVSKNHQGQSFMIQIAPDPEKDPDIAPAYSRSVCVKSKMKKRKRGNMAAPDGHGHKPVMGIVGSSSSGVHTHTNLPNNNTPLTISVPSQNAQRLRQAMSGVIKWTEEVVNGLFPLKWQVLGYGQFPDGSIDYSRPYHNMPNPNDCIHRILSMYADDTRENLRVLLSAVEQTTNQDGINHPQATDMNPQPNYNQDPQFPPKRRRSFNEFDQGFQPHNPYPTPPAMPGMPQPPPSVMGVHQQIHMPGQHPQQPGQHQQQQPGPHMPWMQPHVPGQNPKMPHLQTPSVDQEDVIQRTMDDENRQADVKYVLAKQFKSCRTHNRLGFPAFSITKELLGFYKKSSVSMGARFVPIYKHSDEFGPSEIAQASRILEDAIAKRSLAVKDLKDWESLSSMVDSALMSERETSNSLSYDWSKDFGDSNSSGEGEIGLPVLTTNNSPHPF